LDIDRGIYRSFPASFGWFPNGWSSPVGEVNCKAQEMNVLDGDGWRGPRLPSPDPGLGDSGRLLR